MTAYQDLMAFQHETSALGQIAGRLGWDQEAVMPKGAGAQRGAEMAAIEAVLHARRSDPRVGEWLAQAEPPDEAGAAQMREIRRAFERSNKVPADLAKALAQKTSEGHGIWAAARASEDVAAFLPTLKELVSLKREEGAALAEGGDIYDALVQDYEPGMSGDDIAALFEAMRPRLVALRAAVLDRPQPPGLSGAFDEAKQMELAEKLAATFGYDFHHGRIDKVIHPFCSGGGADVRITTRTVPGEPFNCLYSTIHEVGHACYEQSIDPRFRFTPLGRGVSMGVHESQSRIYENQLGRSQAFCGWLYHQMTDTFGDIGVDGPDAFYGAVNRVSKGYIRTEADEVQYNLHIMLRFDLERALMSGNLQVDDLEAAWNDRFASDFGYDIDTPSNGCLQDVHWSAGLFGYFPTYALGNVYAGCLHVALRSAVPDLDEQMARGDVLQATGWLRENLQQFGSLYLPRDVITRACGAPPEPEPLLSYLETKFNALYAND